MSAQHTPGPWRHNAVTQGYDIIRDEILCDAGVIADDIREARDATLIAAAPELLEAVNAASELVEFIAELLSTRTYRAEELKDQAAWQDADECMRNGHLASLRDQFAAVIAKARGAA